MIRKIWSAPAEPEFFRQTDKTAPRVRQFASFAGGTALALTFASHTLAAEPASQPDAALVPVKKQTSIQVASLDPEMIPIAPDVAIAAIVRHERSDRQERLILDFKKPVLHSMQLDGDELVIWFDQQARFTLQHPRTGKTSRLRSMEAVGGEATRWMILRLAPNSRYWSEVDHQGRRLVINLGARNEQADSEQKTKPAADTKPLASLSNARRSTGWTPRRRTSAKPEAVALKPDSDADDNSSSPVPLAKPRTAPTIQVRQAAPLKAAPVAKRLSPRKAPIVRAAAENPPPRSSHKAAPGQFDIDEQALDRALERTLTREGAVLLPFGSIEVEPSIAYVRREFDAPTLVNLFGFPAFGETVVQRNEVVATLATRIGLPLDAQLEVDVPYRYVDQSVMTTIGFNALEETDTDAFAFGDIGVGLAKTLIREDKWWPDAVARVRWDSGTGKTADNGVALGGGGDEIIGSLSLVKSQDPLAFFGTVSYEKTFEENDIDRGDRIGVSVGTVLAASPDTSLRASIRQDFIGDAEVNGEDVPGSDRMAATLSIGASSVLGQGLLLDASADIGLTDDAPDYAARVSMPIRFNPGRYLAHMGRDEPVVQKPADKKRKEPGAPMDLMK